MLKIYERVQQNLRAYITRKLQYIQQFSLEKQKKLIIHQYLHVYEVKAITLQLYDLSIIIKNENYCMERTATIFILKTLKSSGEIIVNIFNYKNENICASYDSLIENEDNKQNIKNIRLNYRSSNDNLFQTVITYYILQSSNSMENQKIMLNLYQKNKKSKSPPYNDSVKNSSIIFLSRRKIYGEEQFCQNIVELHQLIKAHYESKVPIPLCSNLKKKLKRFCYDLKLNSIQNINNRANILLQILGYLILSEKHSNKQDGKRNTTLILRDKLFQKIFFQMDLPLDGKLDLFYTAVIQEAYRVLNKKQKILKSILRNLYKVSHESALLKLLEIIIKARNKCFINLQDVSKGYVINYLSNIMFNQPQRKGNNMVIDIITYLLQLFPILISKIRPYQVSQLILRKLESINYNSGQVISLIQLLKTIWRFADSAQRISVIKKLSHLLLNKTQSGLSLAFILSAPQLCCHSIMQIASSGYLSQLIVSYKQQDKSYKCQIISIYKLAALKIKEINSSLAEYLLSLLPQYIKQLQYQT